MPKKVFKNGIANALVDEIPQRYDITPIVPTKDDMHYVVEIVPKNKPARYDEDVWDFSECFAYNVGERAKIDFRYCVPATREAVKYLALFFLEKGAKVSSVSSQIQTLNSHMREIVAIVGGDLERVTENEIISHIRSLSCSPSTKRCYMTFLQYFYSCMSDCGLAHLVDVKELKLECARLKEIAKHQQTKHHPYIPDDYLNEIITFFDKVMRDEAKPLDHRLTAGVMLIDTQIGIRASELVIMSKDCTRKAETTKGERPYLVYRCKKAARRFYEVKEIEHIATPLAFKTLDYYLTLRERSRHADEDFLYIDESSGQYPVKEQLFRRRYRELFRLYHPESAREIEGIEPTKFKNDDRLWCIPAIHSYRVNVFSAMANQGVPYPFIEKMMSHSPSAKSDNCYYSGVKTVNKVWEDLCDEDNIDDFSIDE